MRHIFLVGFCSLALTLLSGGAARAVPIVVSLSTPMGGYNQLVDMSDTSGKLSINFGAAFSTLDPYFLSSHQPLSTWIDPGTDAKSWTYDASFTVGFRLADDWDLEHLHYGWTMPPRNATPALSVTGPASLEFGEGYDYGQQRLRHCFDFSGTAKAYDGPGYGSDRFLQEAPRTLVDLLNHPERVSIASNWYGIPNNYTWDEENIDITIDPFTPAPVPEPTSLAVFGLLIGAGLLRKVHVSRHAR